MLKFLVLKDGRPASDWPIRNAYLIGSDGHAIRSKVSFSHGMVCFDNRENGSVSAMLQQEVGECGELTLQTCLLPHRDDPYLLNVELARHRLLVLYNKLEDWGMFDLGPSHVVTKRAELGRKKFIEAVSLQSEDPAKSDKLAMESLVASINGSEELAMAHAELLLNRRKTAAALPKHPFGCGMAMELTNEGVRGGMLDKLDFLRLPVSWQSLAPVEGEYSWDVLDNWAQWLLRHRVPIVAGPLINYEPGQVPDWLFIWEHDFETLRDLTYEHVEEVVKRYRHVVSAWNVVSGLHLNSHFSFSFDQILDLTRMTTLQVKDVHPTAKVFVEIREPFGEYFSQNQRSIPPLMYADLLIQGGINFDGFVVKLFMGQSQSGQYTRDLLQISNLLDQFATLGKPVHLTMGVPSGLVPASVSHERGKPRDENCGHWRKSWSQATQAHWLAAVCQIGLSKPFVESVAWQDLFDHARTELPLGGLLAQNLQPKGAFGRLIAIRRQLLGQPVKVEKNMEAESTQL